MREREKRELECSDEGPSLASLAVVWSFEHLPHCGTTLEFCLGCYFRARMPLFSANQNCQGSIRLKK